MDIQGFEIPVEELLGLTLCKEERDEGEIVESLAKLDELFVSLESMFTKLSKQDVYLLTACLTYFSIGNFSIARERGWNADNIRTLIPNVWRIHRGSRFIKHMQDWPKGYPGDYQIVNMIVDRNDETQEFNLSSVLGSLAINSVIAQQHREKINEQSEMIKNVCLDIDSPNIAVDSKAVYLTADFFTGGQKYLVYILEKEPLLSGSIGITRSMLITGSQSYGIPVTYGDAPAMYMIEHFESS